MLSSKNIAIFRFVSTVEYCLMNLVSAVWDTPYSFTREAWVLFGLIDDVKVSKRRKILRALEADIFNMELFGKTAAQ